MEKWRYGYVEIWSYEDMKILRFEYKKYEIGDMVYGIRIRDIGEG